MSVDGGDKTVILKTPETQIKIDDFAGNRIIYRSVYLPEETAIVISIVNRMNLKLNKEDRKNA